MGEIVIELRPLLYKDFEDLFAIEQREYPEALRAPALAPFSSRMADMEGFTLFSGECAVGAIYFQRISPIEVVMHGFTDKAFIGRWATRTNVRTILRFPFSVMSACRVSVPLITGSMPVLERVLLKAGFKVEGIIRKALLHRGTVFDITSLSLIEEDIKF